MLTQEKLDSVFSALRQAHTSHWRVPRLQDVIREIERRGKYVFRIGSNPWVADVIITEDAVSYEVNEELPERMRAQAEELKKRFEKLTSSS